MTSLLTTFPFSRCIKMTDYNPKYLVYCPMYITYVNLFLMLDVYVSPLLLNFYKCGRYFALVVDSIALSALQGHILPVALPFPILVFQALLSQFQAAGQN
ncbi:hypothetical protein SLEP1_g22277 [Rubroshorea leprosula]|uniref:Uncharacterized protein n=1 Tax=Rubroshorea leprosula TaxID=152421 RepID=A0AAV5J8P1_9ROSI|nr:hypothetical protein SLEP1_g22277 [Rubroshorea leprosula]